MSMASSQVVSLLKRTSVAITGLSFLTYLQRRSSSEIVGMATVISQKRFEWAAASRSRALVMESIGWYLRSTATFKSPNVGGSGCNEVYLIHHLSAEPLKMFVAYPFLRSSR